MKLIKDKLTNTTFKALDFGGPDIFQVNGTWVYGPDNYNNPSLIYGDTTITLDPAGIVIDKPKGSNEWTIIDHQNIGTCYWRITVKNTSGQVLTGVYPFNLGGKVYKLNCAENIWVMASCGGYEIESSWSGKQTNDCYRLKGTGEVITKNKLSFYSQAVIAIYEGENILYEDFILNFLPSSSNTLIHISIGNYGITKKSPPFGYYNVESVSHAIAQEMVENFDLSNKIYKNDDGNFVYITSSTAGISGTTGNIDNEVVFRINGIFI